MNKTILEEEELFSSFGKNYNFEKKNSININFYSVNFTLKIYEILDFLFN
jgi:hypothetical protein